MNHPVEPDAPPGNWLLGNDPVKRPLNVRRELRDLRRDPMAGFLRRLRPGPKFTPWADDVAMYEEGYEFFYLSFARFLPELSIAHRWRNGAYYALKYRHRLTLHEREVNRRFKAIAAFFYYDFWNCLVHSRILCDRAIALTRHFLRGPQLPSFRSFADHKKFFASGKSVGPRYVEYERKIVHETEWFNTALRYVRDQYLVHAGTPHMRLFGHAESGDLQVILVLPSHPDSAQPLEQARNILVSVRRLAIDLRGFLRWLGRYATAHMPSETTNTGQPTFDRAPGGLRAPPTRAVNKP